MSVSTIRASVAAAMMLRLRSQAASASATGRLTVMRSERYSVGRAATIAGTPVRRDGAHVGSPRKACSSSAGGSNRARMPAPLGTVASTCPSSRSIVIARAALVPAWAMMAVSAAIGTSTTASATRLSGKVTSRAR